MIWYGDNGCSFAHDRAPAPPMGEDDRVTTHDSRAQTRAVGVLVVGQVMQGLGQGATLAMGAVLAAQLAGDAWSGAAATGSTLGAALASIPLARLALRFGRRPALALGAGLSAVGSATTIVAAGTQLFPLLVAGFLLLGVGTSVGLQARFAATDAAAPDRRGRDLSLVVWSTTIGAVVGPNLFGPGAVIGEWLHLPELTGSFVIAITAQVLACVLYLVALRPDPLHLARAIENASTASGAAPIGEGVIRSRRVLVFAIAAIAASHAVMVSVMSMTPVHLSHHGAALTIIGLTISLHVAGMYALSPVFGWLSDRFGRIPLILLGQAMSAAATLTIAFGSESNGAVTVGLILLGLGWSAATVSGSALVTDLVTGRVRVKVQGRTDTLMSLAGAAGGALAGPVLALIGYSGLAWVALAIVAVVAATSLVMLPREPARVR